LFDKILLFVQQLSIKDVVRKHSIGIKPRPSLVIRQIVEWFVEPPPVKGYRGVSCSAFV